MAMPHLRAPARPRRPAAALALTVAVTLVAAVLAALGPAGPARGYPGANVELKGHGNGHGRGMGQYGALGYALNGWSYGQILDRYYGGTAMGTIADIPMTVRITRYDNVDTVVVAGNLAVTTPLGLGPFSAVKVQRTGANTYDLYSGSGCGNGFTTPIALGVTGPVTLVPTAAPSDDRTSMLQLCEAGSTRWYRGSFEISSNGTAHTVNRLTMEAYLRGVVPRESPSAWVALGGGAGMQALRAQAVAARSYAAVQNRDPFAKTCDTEACQVYSGFGVQDAAGYRDLEAPATTTAVTDTAGLVRVFPSNGAVASTEFSSSTGGYSAGGTFPAVVDEGDTVAQNPYHDWTATVPVAAIEAAYPAIGPLQSVDVLRRNTLGDMNGRVLDLVLVGTAGRQQLTGAQFRVQFNLRSDWFTVTNNASGGVAGYWVVASDGGIFAFGAARFYGSMGAKKLNQPILGMAPTATGNGYWLDAADGGIFSFGDARFFGSTGNRKLNQPVVGMAPTPTGAGYWMVARDGGIFAFGDAGFFGSTGAIRLNKPVVGMAPTPSGKGYWLVASDGGIFAYGDAAFRGSTGAIALNQPVVAMAATPTGAGYWLLAADGGIFAFGDATFLGSLPGVGVAGPARGIQSTRSGAGYLVANDAGRVLAFGDAPFLSDVAAAVPKYGGGVRGLSVRFTQ